MDPDAKLTPGRIGPCLCFQGTLHGGACLYTPCLFTFRGTFIMHAISKALCALQSTHRALTLPASAPMDPWPLHPGEASSPCSLPQSHFIILRFYFCSPVHLGHFLFPSAFSALSLFQAVVITVLFPVFILFVVTWNSRRRLVSAFFLQSCCVLGCYIVNARNSGMEWFSFVLKYPGCLNFSPEDIRLLKYKKEGPDISKQIAGPWDGSCCSE